MKKIYYWLPVLAGPFLSEAQQIEYTSLHTSSTFDAYTIDISKPVGSTAGEAGVSPTGGATYSIPVVIPPGTNGVVPAVSLEYNSQSGPGSAGMGWNLSGLSVISRVPRNVYFDGTARPVQLDANDRFALDGQRLVLKTGTYGSTGSAYGTEVENFATATLKDVPSSSLKWFEVVTKEGVKMEYGRNADARFLDETSSVVIFWALNRVVYPDGNYIDYQYTASGREEPRLSKILYTGNLVTNAPTYNEIQFDYKIRQEGDFSDSNTIYIGGSSVTSRHLLDQITIKAEGVTTRSY